MRWKRLPAVWVIPVLLINGVSDGQLFVEGFDGGSNEGGWTWGAGDTFPGAGGNPGTYLQTLVLDTPAPRPRTTSGGLFVGDYRALGIEGIGADFITLNNVSTGGRPCSLMLIHDNGTGTPFDDTAAYFLGPNIPGFGAGWMSYDYVIPSQEPSLPAGWQLLNLGDIGAPPNHTWDEVITDVSQVQFHFGDPTFFFIFQTWHLGMDNMRALFVDGAVPGDVTGDGFVNVEDIVQVILQWGSCPAPPESCSADLNGDDRVNVVDLTTVILNWG